MPFSISIIYAIGYLARIVNLLILVRVVFAWINPNTSNPIVALVYSVTDPIIEPIRNFIFVKLGYSGMMDFSPLVAIFLINYLFFPMIIRLLQMFLI